jgi:O-antigen ligase
MSEINPPSLRGASTPPPPPPPSLELRGTSKRGIFKISNFKFQILLEYGLYIFVFLLPWQTKLILRPGVLNGGNWGYGTIALYGTDILLIGLLVVFAFQYFCHPERSVSGVKDLKCNEILKSSGIIDPSRGAPWPGRQDDKEKKDSLSEGGLLRLARNDKVVWVILSGLDLVIFISIFFAEDLILALYRYGLFLLGIGLFWLVVKVKYDKIKLAIAFFSALLIQSALAGWQFLAQNAFADKWLGLAAHSPGDLGASVIETFSAEGLGERWLRAYGSLDHPNVLGGVLSLGLIVLAYIYLRGYFKKDEIKKEKIKNKKFFLFSFLIFILALLLTFSRSAWLALAAGLALFLITFIFKKDWAALKRLGLVIILSAVLSGVIFINYQNLFFTRYQGIFFSNGGAARLELKSVSERKMYFDDSLKLIKKNWLIGSGIGNYTKALAEKEKMRPWYQLEPVHNVFLLVWAETGIFGLIFFIAFLAALFRQSAKSKNLLGLSLLGALAIIMMFDHYFWSLRSGILFFWLATGIVYKNLNHCHARENGDDA